MFHDIRFAEVARSIREVRWWWLPLAVVCDLLVYFCAAWEWQILLRPIGRLSLLQSTQATFAGRFANDVLPVHVGYVIRVYLASRWMGARVASVISSLIVERLFDGLWLALGVGLTAVFLPVPAGIRRTAAIWGGIIVGGAAAVLVITSRRRTRCGATRDSSQTAKFIDRALEFVHRLVEGVRQIGRSRLIVAAGAISLLKLGVQALAFLSLLWAYGFQFTFLTQLAVFMIAYLGISVPSTPASVGVFQLFCVTGLRLAGVSKAVAGGFSLLAFIVLTVPLSVAGFIALAQSGLSLRQLRQELEHPRSRT